MSPSILYEPTTLEYARFHGLATDHRAVDCLAHTFEVTEPPGFIVPDFSELFVEDKLQISKGAAEILAEVKNPPAILNIILKDNFLPCPPTPSPAIDEPLAVEDEDLIKIGGSLEEILETIRPQGREREIQDPEAELPSPLELITFAHQKPTSKSETEEVLLAKIGNKNENSLPTAKPVQERVKITKEVMQYLERVLRPHFPEDDKTTLLEKALAWSKNKYVDSVSQPVPPTQPFPQIRTTAVLRGGGGGSIFSTSDSVSDFMKTRNQKGKAKKETINFPEDKKKPKPESRGFEELEDKEDIQVPQSPPTRRVHISLPELKFIHHSRTIFFNSGTLKLHQGLIRFLEKWGGQALTIIYRELKQDISKGDVFGTADEIMPDIILTPNKGLLFTTMQALTQRELPGTKSMTLLHERLGRLGQVYDTLFIMVTVVVQENGRGWFNDNHANTVVEFVAFCKGVTQYTGCEITPLYMPVLKNGDRSRTKDSANIWTANLIAENAFAPRKENAGLVFLQDATTWESFLCAAGFNAFAAQYILGLLKEPRGGLREFLGMEQEDMVGCFGDIVGEKMLRVAGRRVHGLFAGVLQERRDLSRLRLAAGLVD